MGQLCVSARARRVLAVGVLLAAAPAATAAQSDGSLEQAYARECGKSQDTTACKALREAMERSAQPTAASDQRSSSEKVSPGWGDYASLAGTTWREATGVMFRYRWEQRGEVMVIEAVSPNAAVVHRASRSPEGSIQITLESGEVGAISSPRPGVVVQTFPGRRTIMRFAPGVIGVEQQTLSSGVWQPASVSERRPVADAEFEAAFADRTEKNRIYAETWGKLPQLVGYWTSGGYVWRGQWNKERSILTADLWTAAGEYAYKFQFYVDETRQLQAVSGASTYKVDMLPDGNVFLDGTDDAIIWRSPTAFVFENGRMKDGAYVRKETQTAGWNGTFRKMSTAQSQAFREQIKRYDQQQASSGGGGGMFGALMAATGAVLAGGDAGQVLGAASQGAQMADPGSGTASALGQVAGAVGAPQIDFQAALTGSVTGGAVGGAGGSYPTKPNLALGACPGFTEGNYRTVALEPGNDVQRKTMCGQAFEFYTMYKRAIAQGYSEADANRTYAAHEGAVANLQSFVGN